jgi:hypothetical protein
MAPPTRAALAASLVRDEEFRRHVGNALASYALPRRVGWALRPVVRRDLEEAVGELSEARLLARPVHSGRGTIPLSVLVVVLGALFNPITGPHTRHWLRNAFGDDSGPEPAATGEV